MRLTTGALLITLVAVLSGCQTLKNLGDDNEAKDWSAQRFYQEGKEALNKGNYEDAIRHFEGLEARYPYGRYAQQAQIEIAYAYYKYGEPESAVAAADRFIRLHPAHPHVDYVYYLKGLSHFNPKRNIVDKYFGTQDISNRDPRAAREAFEAFRELVNRFPDSRYAADARDRMTYLVNALALHDIGVARFYIKYEAYVAAVNRCKYVIEHYPTAPAVEDALGIMVSAYRKMGLDKLAEDSLRVLQQNYPRSPYLAKAGRG